MRQQFYRFAHQRLAAEVHKDPQGWWRRLSSEGAAPLERVWNEAGQGLGAADKGNFAGFEVRPISSVPGVDAIAVMMPAPKAPAECHAVALARKAGSTGPIRYFVLEKGSDDDGGAPRAFWAEWRSAPGGVTMRVRGQDVSPITVEAMLADIASELEIDVSGGPDWSVLGGAPPGPPPPRASGGKGGKIFKVGCAALTLMMVALCGFGGYLAWLEEGRSWNEPGDEVAATAVKPGKPFKFEFVWDGTNYAFNELWLVVDGKEVDGKFLAAGKIGCARSGDPEERDFAKSLTDYEAARLERDGERFSVWLKIGDEYDRASPQPFTCRGVVEAKEGKIKKARIIVTRRQRPSDFLAF